MKLFHYAHCPFCIRVRLTLGFLEIPYESVMLPYDDEETPINLCGKKMLPILQWRENDQMNESLDIIRRLDEYDHLNLGVLEKDGMGKFIEDFLDQLATPIHNLCMPYWVWSPEFNQQSRAYFMNKKEKKRGPFFKLIQNKQQYLDMLPPLLNEIEHQLHPYYKSDEFTIMDILIASHIWGLYVFPEFQFSPEIHRYLQHIKILCKFDYHQDFWKGPRV